MQSLGLFPSFHLSSSDDEENDYFTSPFFPEHFLLTSSTRQPGWFSLSKRLDSRVERGAPSARAEWKWKKPQTHISEDEHNCRHRLCKIGATITASVNALRVLGSCSTYWLMFSLWSILHSQRCLLCMYAVIMRMAVLLCSRLQPLVFSISIEISGKSEIISLFLSKLPF